MQLESIKNLTKENSFKSFKIEGEPVVTFEMRENSSFISQIMNMLYATMLGQVEDISIPRWR